MQEHQDKIKSIAVTLISQIDPAAQVQVTCTEDAYSIQVDSEPSGAFIGYHGESLQSLQTILSIILKKQIDPEIRVSVNVADYQEKRQEQLENMADRAVDIVRQTQMSHTLPSLSGKERRYIHLYLSELNDLRTESVGEGEERRLVIFPEIPDQV